MPYWQIIQEIPRLTAFLRKQDGNEDLDVITIAVRKVGYDEVRGDELADYEVDLGRRGSLTFWAAPEPLGEWAAPRRTEVIQFMQKSL